MNAMIINWLRNNSARAKSWLKGKWAQIRAIIKKGLINITAVSVVLITAWWVYPTKITDPTVGLITKIVFLVITVAFCRKVWNGEPRTRFKCAMWLVIVIIVNNYIHDTVMPEYRRNQALVAAEEASASKPKSKDWGVRETELVVDTTPRLYTFGHELSKPIPSSEGFPDNVNIEFDVITRGVAYEIYRVDDTGNTELIGRLLPIGHPDRTVLRNIGKIRALRVRLPDGEPAKEAVLWVRTTPK